jgi:hypothetical protein
MTFETGLFDSLRRIFGVAARFVIGAAQNAAAVRLTYASER